MKNRIALYLILCFMFIFAGCVKTDKQSKQLKQERKRSVVNAGWDMELIKYGAKFIPPKGWSKMPGAIRGAVFYESPDKKAKIALRIPQRALAASFELSLQSVRSAKKAVSEEKLTLAGVPCYSFTFEPANDVGVKMKIKEYQLFKNGYVYSIDCASEAAVFDTYAKDFEKALKGFSLD